MNRRDKIFVAGRRGLVGSAIVRRLLSAGFDNLVTPSRSDLDLTDQRAVQDFFARIRAKYVVLAAARVGGILANATCPAEFIRENLLIETNVIHEAYIHGVEHLLFLGSSCIYPRDCPQPIREEYFMTGPLERTNSAYAVAKIAGVEMCHAYNRQYGTRYICAMPTNLYGPGDNFDAQTSHVLPAMIRKFHQAKLYKGPVVLWGTGAAKREFLHVDDLADACVHIMTMPEDRVGDVLKEDSPPLINIGCGQDLSIRELAQVVGDIIGFKGQVQWDHSKPDGTPRKLLDIAKLRRLGWEPKTPLQDGIRAVYEWFQEREAIRQ
ncbi:MAG TPA: GDP-L-fucose synthase [Candidatus Angelobacter sp.]